MQKEELERHQRDKDMQGDKVDYLNEQISEARKERNKLQERYEELVSKPFFKNKADNTNFKNLEELKQKLDKIKRETEKSVQKLMQHKKDYSELEKEKRDIEHDRDFYSKELKRISTIMDPNGINPEIVVARLRAEDNNAYRKMMHDLKLEGDEPEWEKQDLLDSIKKD